jgi:hypothetical protein
MSRHQRARRFAIYRGAFWTIGVFTLYVLALGLADKITGA